MKNKRFNHKNLLKGVIFSASGSFWWGVIGVIYFKHVSFVGPIELVMHRAIWTSLILLFTTRCCSASSFSGMIYAIAQ